MKKLYIITLLLLTIVTRMQAQQYLGIRGGNFSGVFGAYMNPSFMVDGRIKWDVNLASGGTTFDNTFLYIPKDQLTFFGIGNIVDQIKDKGYTTHFDPNNPNDKYDATFSTEVMGPSFMFNFAKKHALGFTTAARFFMPANDVPGHVAQNAYTEMRDTSLWDINWLDNSTQFNMLGWYEYGISYATVLYMKDKHELTGGITLKYLQGVGGAYVKNTDVTYNIVDDNNLLFTNSSIDYGNVDYNNFDNIQNYNDLIHGDGFGGNIGFTYVHRRDSAEYTYIADCKTKVDANKSLYVYRLGVSVIDIGSINFDDGAGNYHLETESADWENWKGENFGSNQDFNKSISYIFYGDSTASFVGSNFKMALPTAFVFQGDWNFYKNFYLNGTYIQHFGHSSDQGVRRPNVYGLTPRYETKWFEVSVPMSLLAYNTLKPRVGVAVRLGYFFIGGDALGGLMALNDFEGADVYAGVHVFFPAKKLKSVPVHFVSGQPDSIRVNCGGVTTHDLSYTNDLTGSRMVTGKVTSTLGPIPGPCGGDVTEKWDAMVCEQALHAERIIHVNPAAAPTFAAAGNITVECGKATTSELGYDNGGAGNCHISGKVTSKLSVADPTKACGTDIIEVWDYTDACGRAIHAERVIHVNPAPVVPQEIEKISMSAQYILFKTGSAIIEPRLYQTLDVLAEIMKGHPDQKWLIEGNTDNTGSDKINIPLSEHRAEAVKDYLVKQGVNANNLITKGNGSSNPIATNTTAAGRAKNRRTEVKPAN